MAADGEDSTAQPAGVTPVPDTPALEVNYRAEYNQLETAIKSGPIEEFPIFFEGVTTGLKSLINKALLPEEHEIYFKTSCLPKIVLYLLTRSDFHEEEELQKQVNSFFHQVMSYCITQVDEDIRELHATVSRILTATMGFYILPEDKTKEQPTLASKNQIFTESKFKQEYTELRKTDPPISVLYYNNIEFFANEGGFTKLCNRIANIENQNLSLLKHMLSPLLQARDYLKEEFLAEHVPAVKDATFQKLLDSNSGPLIKNEKILTGDIVGSIKALLSHCLSPEQVLESIDAFKLDFGCRGFDSKNLERRLRSLTIITAAVERAMPSKDEKDPRILQFLRRAGVQSRQSPDEEKKEKPKPLSPQFISGWLEESKFVSRLLNKNSHPEEIKQGTLIFRFLAVNKLLTEEQIDDIWAMQEGKHESVKNTIFDSLVLLAEDLSFKHIQHIQERIEAISDKEHDFETLRFISQFTPLAIERDSSQPSVWLGLETLYRLSMECEQIHESVSSGAFDNLVKLLKLNCVAPRRSYFIEKASSNLSSFQSVIPSLKLIQETLKFLPQRKRKNPIGRKEPTRKSTIESINQSYNIIDLVLESLNKYKEAVAGVSPKKLRKSKKTERCSHTDNVSIRLEFLEFILTNSSLTLNNNQAEILWLSLIAKPLIDEETYLGYAWFENALACAISLDESAVNNLFETQVKSIDSEKLSESGYHVFEKYFLQLNEKNNRIKQLTSKSDKKNFIVNHQTDRELIGCETLWNVALDSPNPSIVSSAIKCLNMLHQNVQSESQKARYVAIRENFISRCLDYLEQAISTDPPVFSRVDCCIEVLKILVFDYEAKVIRLEGAGDVTLSVRPDKGSNFTVTLRCTDTIKTLRQAVAEKYGRPMNSIRVLIGSTELKGDKTLKEAKINDSTQLIARAKTHDNTKPISEEERFAEFAQEITLRSWLTQILEVQLNGLGLRSERIGELLHTTEQKSSGLTEQGNLAVRIMGQQNNFQRLFKLLNLQGDIAGRAWDLLNILPPNSSMIDEFARVSDLEQNLTTYLDPAVILKLAYSLNMISILVQRQQDEAKQNLWCDKFLELNGVYRLLDTLLDIPVGDSSAHVTCFNQLLKLINFFVEYQQKTNQKFGTSIADYSRLQDAFVRILYISYTLTKKQDIKNIENIMIGRCFCFVSKVLSENIKLLDDLYNWDSLSDLIQCSLLESPCISVRQQACDELANLCCSVSLPADSLQESPKNYFLKLLLSFLPQIELHPKTSDYYFLLIEKIIRETNFPADDPDATEELILRLIKTIKEHPILEPSETPVNTDTGLIGLLDLLRTLIRSSIKWKELAAQKGLLSELFTNCLFAIPTADNHGADAPPKCKTKDSRYAAYRLLVELCREVPSNFSILVTALLKNMKTVNPRNNWQVIPGAKDKASHGYVGLENMGATCYMNSLMQQLYCMPEFREKILSVTDKSEDRDDSPLYQLQYMFSYLQETLKGSYTPTQFCSSYKDWDGNPINTRVQMDANEFFNTLFDKLEGLLAPTECPNMLKELFGGVLSNQIISQECEHVSENTEEFFTVGVEMKNKKDIYSSLELFIEGEMLQGDSQYRCDLCDKRVDALKRCCLKSLPKILLIQLKRFEFDLQTMRNRKLNDECAFPMELNVEPFTAEGIAKKEAEGDLRKSEALRASLSLQIPHPPEYYQYQLCGVVVHTGTADGGHYYSFIKERVPLQGDDVKWFEFNDSCVEPWDVKKLKQECFGGKRSVQQRDRQSGQTTTVERDILNNGYILVYERISNDSDDLNGSIDESGENFSSAASDDIKNKDEEHSKHEMKAQVPIPEDIMKRIWKENREFIVEKHIFDLNYFNFIWRLINLYTTPEYLSQANAVQPVMQAIELATKFVSEIYARSRQNQLLPMWITHLQNVYENYPTACAWLLKELCGKSVLIKNMLLYCPIERTRSGFASLIEKCFNTLCATEETHYQEQYEATVAVKKLSEIKSKNVSSWSIMFIENLFNLMKDARNPKYSNSQYFVVLRDFLNVGQKQREYLSSRDILKKMIDFIMGSGVFAEKIDPTAAKDARMASYMKGGTRKASFVGPVNVNGAIETLMDVILGMTTTEQKKEWADNPPPTLNLEKGIKLSAYKEDEQEALLSSALFKKILRECYNERITKTFLEHLTWESLSIVEFFMETLKEGFENCVMQSHAKQFLKAVLVIQEIEDSLRLKRIELTCSLVVDAIEHAVTNKHKELARVHASWLNTRKTKNTRVKQWCSKNSSKVNPILSSVPPASPPIRR